MTMLEETKQTAKNVVDQAREGAEHTASQARVTVLDGVKTVVSVLSMIRGLQMGNALGWIGLARRRGAGETLALFGGGFVVGAGAALLFAPVSGADMRRALVDRIRGVAGDAEKAVEKVGEDVKKVGEDIKTEVKAGEKKIEDAARGTHRSAHA